MKIHLREGCMKLRSSSTSLLRAHEDEYKILVDTKMQDEKENTKILLLLNY
jgi:hypothetical protein